jgi:CBS domain-containing protein
MTDRTVIQSITQRPVVTTSTQSSAYQAAGIMTKANCGSILIVDAAGALLGIFTERDVMTRVVAKGLDPEKTLLSEVMTKNPRFIAPDTTVSDAVLLMLERGFRHLPILSASSKIIGVFSIRDASPREISDADSLAQYLDQVNDAPG